MKKKETMDNPPNDSVSGVKARSNLTALTPDMMSPWPAVKCKGIVDEVYNIDCLIHDEDVPAFDCIRRVESDDPDYELSICNSDTGAYRDAANRVSGTAAVALYQPSVSCASFAL